MFIIDQNSLVKIISKTTAAQFQQTSNKIVFADLQTNCISME